MIKYTLKVSKFYTSMVYRDSYSKPEPVIEDGINRVYDIPGEFDVVSKEVIPESQYRSEIAELEPQFDFLGIARFDNVWTTLFRCPKTGDWFGYEDENEYSLWSIYNCELPINYDDDDDDDDSELDFSSLTLD